MAGTEVASTGAASTAKATITAYLVAHPIGVAVVGGVLIGVGAYYLGKTLANRKNKEATESGDASGGG
ncbi:MAG: hypothetical protein GY862_07550 [Gammaproteobacteria bacterium]|nr:hypothetical protein [Gammaproteobacteria bacterium]